MSPLLSALSLLYLHPAPVSLSSFHVYSTTTTAHLTWKLHRQQSLSILSLYNTRAGSFTHVFNVTPSEAAKSQYTVFGLQHGTRFKVKAMVTTLLKHHNVVLKQRLSIGMETGMYTRAVLQQHIKHETDCKLMIISRLQLIVPMVGWPMGEVATL